MESSAMAAAEKGRGAHVISLDSAKVLHIDCEAESRSQLEATLRGIGFDKIAACDSSGKFTEMLTAEKPDLLFVDIDAEADWAFQTIRAIRNGEIGECAFVVIVALTQKPELEAVQAALQAGSDDMVVKPVTAQALRQRVLNQIENRKEFIATDDYVGPDRRADTRELTDDDPAAIEVPNSLRHAATGDESAALTEERVKETLRSLSVQKFYHLSRKISSIAGQQRDLLASDADSADCGAAVQEISATLAEIDEIIGEQGFKSVGQVVASTRQALEDIEACGEAVGPRHFELLHAHGDSVAVVLKESDETAGVLVGALEKAVSAVKAKPGPPSAPENEADAPEVAEAADAAVQKGAAAEVAQPAPSKGAQPPPTPQPASQPAPPAQRAKIPLMVRFKAWWDGVDPRDIVAGTAK
jgi:DNA-binding response OmpR family regulator